MIYNDLIVQPVIWEKLKKYSIKKKIPNAFLFHGNNGVGKEGYAIEFISLINCLNKKDYESCKECASCKKMRNLQHGNLKIIHSMPRGKIKNSSDSPFKSMSNLEIEDYKAILFKKSKNPYYKIEIPRANSILINSIRYLKKELSLSSIEKGWNIILILDAEKLCYPNNTSANALLKILEEPPRKTLFILTTSNYSKIIDTIKSRCQAIYFPPLTDKQIYNAIDESLPEIDRNIISIISNGNLYLAKDLENSLDEVYNNLKLFINSCYNFDLKHDDIIVRKINSLKQSSNQDLILFFRTLIIYFKDLFVFSKSKDIKYVVYKNLDKHYEKISKYYNITPWDLCMSVLENGLNNIYRNGSIPLLVNGMLIEIREIIHNSTREQTPFNINNWLENK